MARWPSLGAYFDAEAKEKSSKIELEKERIAAEKDVEVARQHALAEEARMRAEVEARSRAAEQNARTAQPVSAAAARVAGHADPSSGAYAGPADPSRRRGPGPALLRRRRRCPSSPPRCPRSRAGARLRAPPPIVAATVSSVPPPAPTSASVTPPPIVAAGSEAPPAPQVRVPPPCLLSPQVPSSVAASASPAVAAPTLLPSIGLDMSEFPEDVPGRLQDALSGVPVKETAKVADLFAKLKNFSRESRAEFLKQFAPSVSDSDCTMLAEAKMDVDDGVPVLTVEGPCIESSGGHQWSRSTIRGPRTRPRWWSRLSVPRRRPCLTVDDPRAERPAVLAVEAPCVDEGALALAVDPPCISEAQCYAAVRPPHQACDARNGVGREAGNGVAYTAVVYGDAGPLDPPTLDEITGEDVRQWNADLRAPGVSCMPWPPCPRRCREREHGAATRRGMPIANDPSALGGTAGAGEEGGAGGGDSREGVENRLHAAVRIATPRGAGDSARCRGCDARTSPRYRVGAGSLSSGPRRKRGQRSRRRETILGAARRARPRHAPRGRAPAMVPLVAVAEGARDGRGPFAVRDFATDRDPIEGFGAARGALSGAGASAHRHCAHAERATFRPRTTRAAARAAPTATVRSGCRGCTERAAGDPALAPPRGTGISEHAVRARSGRA